MKGRKRTQAKAKAPKKGRKIQKKQLKRVRGGEGMREVSRSMKTIY